MILMIPVKASCSPPPFWHPSQVGTGLDTSWQASQSMLALQEGFQKAPTRLPVGPRSASFKGAPRRAPPGSEEAPGSLAGRSQEAP